MLKTDRPPSVTDILDAVAECPDVQHLVDEDVVDVAGGPEVTNTGGEA